MFNIFFLVFFAIVVAAVLAVFITRTSSPSKESFLLPEPDMEKDDKSRPALTSEDLKRVVLAFCEARQLKVKEDFDGDGEEHYWIAVSEDPIHYGTYVFGAILAPESRPLVPLAQVLEFKDFVKGAGSSRGFLLTTGYFSRDVHQPLEGVPIALYNRRRVLEELDKLARG